MSDFHHIPFQLPMIQRSDACCGHGTLAESGKKRIVHFTVVYARKVYDLNDSLSILGGTNLKV